MELIINWSFLSFTASAAPKEYEAVYLLAGDPDIIKLGLKNQSAAPPLAAQSTETTPIRLWMHWDTSSVMFPEIPGCYWSHDIRHPRSSDPARADQTPTNIEYHHARNIEYHRARNIEYHQARNIEYHHARNIEYHRARNIEYHQARNIEYHHARNIEYHRARNIENHLARNVEYHLARNIKYRLALPLHYTNPTVYVQLRPCSVMLCVCNAVVCVCAENDAPPTYYLLCGGPVGVLTIEEQGIFSQSGTEGGGISLVCGNESKVVWSKRADVGRSAILTAEGGVITQKLRADPGNRYRVLPDLSLWILNLSLSDSGTYYCNAVPVVDLRVYPAPAAGMPSRSGTEGRGISLVCGNEGKVVWGKGAGGGPSTILTAEGGVITQKHRADPGNRYRVLADLSLWIENLSLSDSGTYYCNSVPVVYLTVHPAPSA
ncbi:hypothetical protein NFI96_025297, partial [Prochilodus magdalenae]